MYGSHSICSDTSLDPTVPSGWVLSPTRKVANVVHNPGESDVRIVLDNRGIHDGASGDNSLVGADRARDPSEDRTLTLRPNVGRLTPQYGTPLMECPTSLDLTTRHGESLAFSATSPGDLDLILFTRGEVVIEACDYMCFPDERIDEETGEVSQFTRTVLYDVCGSLLRLSGKHIPHKIAALCDMYGWPRWEHPVKLRVKTRKGRRGWDYHDIQIVE